MALQKITDIASVGKNAIVLALYEDKQFYGGVYAEKGYNLADFSTNGKVFVINGSERIPITLNEQNTYGTCDASDFDSSFLVYCWVKQTANAELTDLPLYFWGLGATYTGKQVITAGETLNLEVTADSGKVFETAPYLTVRNNGEETDINFTISENGKKATLTYQVGDIACALITAFTVDGAEPPSDVTVINNIEGTTETHEYDGTTVSITVDSDYLNKSRIDNPKAQYTGSDGQPVTVDMESHIYTNYSSATVTITDFDARQPITITGTLISIIPTQVNLSNCVSDKPLPEYTDFGSTLDVNLTANPNTEFKDDGTSYIKLWYGSFGEKKNIPFVISPDKRTASITYEATEQAVVRIVINGESFPIKIVGGQYGSINVYKVSMDNLTDFAKARFGESYDLGSYVNRINRIFADVPVLSSDVLRCGDYNTGIEVEQPDLDTLTLDFGNVTIPAHNENTTDFDGEVQVFLPFKGFVNIPVDYVGKNINLQYVVDIITGNGIAKLSYDGIVFQIEETQPSQPVIYRTSENELRTVGDDDWNTYILYGLEPYIYCKWYEGIDVGRNNDLQTGEIGDFRGFNMFDDVTPIHTPEMLAEEQEMIYTALSDGVYIE